MKAKSANTSQYQCIAACQQHPLHRDKANTIRDLLLSVTAIGDGVQSDKVTEAFDQLIALKYPLINRLLESAAYLARLGGLCIYVANSEEFHHLKVSGDNHGFYNPNARLIVLSRNLPLAELLIHELAHAITHNVLSILGMSWDNIDREFAQFGRLTYPATFNLAKQGPRVTTSEQEELEDIDYKANYIASTAHTLMRGMTMTQQTQFMNQQHERCKIFVIRRQRVLLQQQIRRAFFDCFQLYQAHDFAGEAMPFFLQLFVRFATTEHSHYLDQWHQRLLNTKEQPSPDTYGSLLLNHMHSAIPKEATEFFLTGKIRSAIDYFAKASAQSYLKQQDIPSLQDQEMYSSSLAEPQKIIHSRSF